MKFVVEVTPEEDFRPDGPPVPETAADELLDWLHDASGVLPTPPWLGSFDDAEEEREYPRRPTGAAHAGVYASKVTPYDGGERAPDEAGSADRPAGGPR